ncbi:hypothetical protein FDP41_010801 [Naegleria fowleri]|uniref:F-box domain-containing protein n=1 Tax=Naegleria fowleri TaxID=5763 RepID=A0A6A5C7H2_NAEFO|nr:uncharacterized protein FDP41_010801 [Naegleria fowleri]KAF0982822.1 hypothetical protein FDP41_010801 [Naegleria fowleri]
MSRNFKLASNFSDSISHFTKSSPNRLSQEKCLNTTTTSLPLSLPPSSAKLTKTDGGQTTPFISFSFDTLTVIFSYLSTLELVRNASLVSKLWNDVSTSNTVWSPRFFHELGPPEWFIEKLNQTLKRTRSGLNEKDFIKVFYDEKQVLVYEDDPMSSYYDNPGKDIEIPKQRNKTKSTHSSEKSSTVIHLLPPQRTITHSQKKR